MSPDNPLHKIIMSYTTQLSKTNDFFVWRQAHFMNFQDFKIFLRYGIFRISYQVVGLMKMLKIPRNWMIKLVEYMKLTLEENKYWLA